LLFDVVSNKTKCSADCDILVLSKVRVFNCKQTAIVVVVVGKEFRQTTTK